MKQAIIHVTLVVENYDDAITFYVNKLKFELSCDTLLPDGKRWVVVTPPGDASMSLLLAQAATPDQSSCVGDQTGGRVFLFLATDNFKRDYSRMLEQGITFTRPPETQSYGTVAVFADLYGNLWDLLEPSPEHPMYSQVKGGS